MLRLRHGSAWYCTTSRIAAQSPSGDKQKTNPKTDQANRKLHFDLCVFLFSFLLFFSLVPFDLSQEQGPISCPRLPSMILRYLPHHGTSDMRISRCTRATTAPGAWHAAFGTVAGRCRRAWHCATAAASSLARRPQQVPLVTQRGPLLTGLVTCKPLNEAGSRCEIREAISRTRRRATC